MKALIVFDSQYGNTARIADSIAAGFGSGHEVRVAKVDSVTSEDLAGLDLLVVGSPTQAWRSTTPIRSLLSSMSPSVARGLRAAAFDTGFRSVLSGSASKGIEKLLRRQGCTIVAGRRRFYVTGTEGPLEAGEIERAKDWGSMLAAVMTRSEAA